MPLVTHFCGVCGGRVPPADLEEGRATILDHITYCGPCAESAGIVTSRPEPTVPAAAAPPRPSILTSRTRPRAPPRRPRSTARKDASSRSLLVGGAVASIAILAVVAGLALSTGDGGPEPAVEVVAPSARVDENGRAHRLGEARRRDEGWDSLFTGESLSGWRCNRGARIEIVEDDLGDPVLDVRNPGDGDADVAFVPTGADRWKSYRIHLDVRGVVGDLGVYVRAPRDGEDASGIVIPHDRLPRTDGWWPLLIEVDGGRYRVTMDSRKMSEAGASRGIAGGFGLGLRARGRLQVRNVRVKVRR